ncbi:MAG TPA: hypothetical protein VF765_07640 [Polyangiaceae bacterium]
MRGLLGIGAAAAAAVMVCGAGCGGSTVTSGSDAGSDGQGSSGSGSGGASSSSGGGSGSSSGSGGSSGSGSGGGSGSSSGGISMSPCPQNPPSDGIACTVNGAQCEYGTNPDPSCNQIFECLNGMWASGGTGGPSCPGGTCPMRYVDVVPGQACSPSGLACPYAEGECNCSFTTPSGTGTTPTWQCFAPKGCPEPRPRIGDACTATQEGLSCDYGACAGGVSVTCTGGFWTWTMTACPG